MPLGCGQGWSPVVDRNFDGPGHENYKLPKAQAAKDERGIKGRSDGWWPNHYHKTNIILYRPTCECGHDDFIPGIVLDPFVGSGTTVMVAQELQRRGIGLDISFPYLDEQARYRAKFGEQKTRIDDLPLFADLD